LSTTRMFHPEGMQEISRWLAQRHHRKASYMTRADHEMVEDSPAFCDRFAVGGRFVALTGGGAALTTGYCLQPRRGDKAEEKPCQVLITSRRCWWSEPRYHVQAPLAAR